MPGRTVSLQGCWNNGCEIIDTVQGKVVIHFLTMPTSQEVNRKVKDTDAGIALVGGCLRFGILYLSGDRRQCHAGHETDIPRIVRGTSFLKGRAG